MKAIVDEINSSLKGLGGEWMGIAQSLERDNKTAPVIGEKSVGIDDRHKLSVYHKLGAVATKLGKGYGNNFGDVHNTFTNYMVVFINNRHQPDEVFEVILSRMPDEIKLAPYKSIRVTVTGGVLDSETVYGQEYAGSTYRLKPHQYLIRINYTVEAQFKKGCFSQCL